ncbi:hypothetical protein NC653_009504 [Populus alba x Populus x berolinensis]|uniref:Uncharacterized protein n=1 Tax=Populus alba x Populus x berolinensis TaxID=444605 RepID=A0AAD6R9C9_9ROSI|nr:hypothetical protein NC653_009504 [Populus alba x Populus x berolinensis]
MTRTNREMVQIFFFFWCFLHHLLVSLLT